MAKRPFLPLKTDRWNSKFFRKRIVHLNISGRKQRRRLPEELPGLLKRTRNKKAHFFIIKLIGRSLFCERSLGKSGFKKYGESVDFAFRYRGIKAKDSSEGFRVRPFISGDMKFICAIAKDAFRSSYLYRCGFADRNRVDRYHATWVKNLIKDKKTKVFVAEGKSNDPAGFVAVSLDRKRREGRVVLIAVKKRRKRLGIGKALLQRSIAWGEGILDTLFVKTQAGNRAARALYKRMYFVPIEYDKVFCKKMR